MNNITKNILGFVLIGVIAIGGIATPLLLLKHEENGIVGKTNFYVHEASGSEVAFMSENTTLKYEEYINILAAKSMGNVEITEPTAEEINIEQAVYRARSEIQKLMNAGVIERDDISDDVALADVRYERFVLSGYNNKTFSGFWEIQFTASGSYTIKASMDAKSGKILSLEFNDFSKMITKNDIGESITAFLDYLGLSDKVNETDFDEKNPSMMTCVLEDRYMVLYGFTDYHTISLNFEVTSAGIKKAISNIDMSLVQGYENNA